MPGTDLHFCPQSSNPEKVTRLTTLFSRLILPDGTGFPEGSVQLRTPRCEGAASMKMIQKHYRRQFREPEIMLFWVLTPKSLGLV